MLSIGVSSTEGPAGTKAPLVTGVHVHISPYENNGEGICLDVSSLFELKGVKESRQMLPSEEEEEEIISPK